MPRSFLYKKKRKSQTDSDIDGDVATDYTSASTTPSSILPLHIGIMTNKGRLIGDGTKVTPYPPPPALHKIIESPTHDSKSSATPVAGSPPDDSKINRVRGVQNLTAANTDVTTPLFINTSSIFELDGVYPRSNRHPAFGQSLGAGGLFPPHMNREPKTRHPQESKLRDYLESSKKLRNEVGDVIVAVENPWAEGSKFYRPVSSSVTPTMEHGLFPPFPVTTAPPNDEPAPDGSDQRRDTVSSDDRPLDHSAALNSFYQSHFNPGSYYGSLYLRHLHAWHEARQSTDKVKEAEVINPFYPYMASGFRHHTLFGDYRPGLSRYPQFSPEDAGKESNLHRPFVGIPKRKNSMRQPVDGVEYVKNDVEMEHPASKWGNKSNSGQVYKDRAQRISSTDRILFNQSFSPASSSSRNTTGTGTAANIPPQNVYDRPTLKTILNAPPPPPPYRAGRRSASGKPPQPRKYVCDVCGKAFSRSNTLVTHKRIHTGDKPFSCELCGRAFRQPGNLTRHRLTHTTVKPYVCTQCGKAFNRASNLHTHMRTHTNYKPFECEFCGKGFHQKIDMKIHSYTHTGEKPHKCKTCGRGFKQLTHLTYHMRTHSEEKDPIDAPFVTKGSPSPVH